MGLTEAGMLEQPLLNYLLALLREDRMRTGSEPVIGSVHALYAEVFELLYKRKKGQLATSDQAQERFELSDYKRFLEEVAIAAWHTGDRSVTDTDLNKRFENENDRKLIEQHYGTLESGVFAILNSFFVAPGGGGPSVYTFTHKSFREFLTASRLVREVETICELRNNRKGRYSQQDALVDWYALTGPSVMNKDLLNFVREEIAARGPAARACPATRRRPRSAPPRATPAMPRLHSSHADHLRTTDVAGGRVSDPRLDR